jgi:hypothetical protein
VKKDLINLQFDQYSRQKMVLELINTTRTKDSLKILDVGGHLGKTEDFFLNDKVTIVDLYDVKKKNYKKANALDLPFDDGQFDVVVSFDVFEHIRDEDRETFIRESLRVSNDIFVLAAPFDTDMVSAVENDANTFYKELYHKDHPWLTEHIENGLPKLDRTKKFLDKNRINYEIFSSNNVFLWKIMMGFMFVCGDSRLNMLSEQVNRYYNEHKDKLGDHTEPSYRKVIFARKSTIDGKLAFTFESSIDNEIYNNFLELILNGVRLMLNDKKTSIEEAFALEASKTLKKHTQEIARLNTELSDIKNSRTWKLALKFQRASKVIKK